ncbi:hypothetical protein Hte_008916 [Hypoxylon texense]
MGPTRQEEARGHTLPSYDEASNPSSYPATAVELPADPEPRAPVELPAEVPTELPAEVPAGLPVAGPTVSSPFNFPSDTHLPPYVATSPSSLPGGGNSSSSSSSSHPDERRPVAIPQTRAAPAAPFLDAYSPLLLRHGVTREAWAAFLATLSGFLAATVSRKAVSHAAEMAQHVGDVPRRFGQETWHHAKQTGRTIGDSARRGDLVGAAVHAVRGTIALPVATAFRAVGAGVSLPFAALGAVVREPKTPRERAAAYAESANVKWLRRRGLEAHLLDTAELARALGGGGGGSSSGLSAGELLQTAWSVREYPSAAAQLAALGPWVVDLELGAPGPLELEAGTLWLVVTQRGEDHGHGHGYYHVSENGRGR